MVDRDELRALAAGTPPAPVRVVSLDTACAGDALEAPAAALAAARDAGCRTTLAVCGLGALADRRRTPEAATGSRRLPAGGALPESAAAELLGALRAHLAREGAGLVPEAVALPAAVEHPEELALGAAACCDGAPRIYLLLPHAALEAIQRGRKLGLDGAREIDARRWWGGLLALVSTAPAVSLVPDAPGPGLSVLAPGQRWTGPSPGLAELIPAAPRRLRLDIDFTSLIVASGDDQRALAQLAGRIVASADDLLGRAAGAGGPRRLALQLGGIARAVIATGRDPRTFAALNWVRSRLQAFRDGASAASMRLARARGTAEGLRPFPLPAALEIADKGALDRALLMHGARHSHLVCLSPWSLAPPDLGRDGYGLLPALACADSIAWRRADEECAPALYGEVLRFAWAVAVGN